MITNWINNPSSIAYTINNDPYKNNVDEANYTYNISSSTSNPSFTSFVSTYQNGVYYGEFQNS